MAQYRLSTPLFTTNPGCDSVQFDGRKTLNLNKVCKNFSCTKPLFFTPSAIAFP